jgi:hypothetical protein
MKQISFGKLDEGMEMPHLLDIQTRAFEALLQLDAAAHDREDIGLERVFKDLFPITDVHENFSLEFKSYTLGDPKYSVAECIERDMTYSAPLKATLVYTDPMGSPGATRARLNDLTLKVTAPDGTIYWGNVGLGVGGGMWSTPGGTANIVDTVENVFIERPMAGNWTFEVIASELVADARVETPGVIDADYALDVSGPLAPRDRGRGRTSMRFW